MMYRITTVFKGGSRDRYLKLEGASKWSYSSNENNASMFGTIDKVDEVLELVYIKLRSKHTVQKCVTIQGVDCWIDYKLLNEINELIMV